MRPLALATTARKQMGLALGVLRRKATLLSEVAALRRESEDLRARLVAAQKEKGVALAEAETIRKEKERLRERITALKAELDGAKRVNGQLGEKVAELRAELAEANKGLIP